MCIKLQFTHLHIKAGYQILVWLTRTDVTDESLPGLDPLTGKVSSQAPDQALESLGRDMLHA